MHGGNAADLRGSVAGRLFARERAGDQNAGRDAAVARTIAAPVAVDLARPAAALANLGLFPSFAGMAMLIVASIFAGRGSPPPGIDWVPALIVLTLLLAGLVPAQASLATLCFAWSQGNYWRRFLQFWLVVLAITGAVYTGGLLFASLTAMFNDSGASRPWYGTQEERRPVVLGMLAVLASLPMVLLAVQLPFWFARHFWAAGW